MIFSRVQNFLTDYLTSNLDFLVINDFLIQKKENFKKHIADLTIRLPLSARLRQEKRYTSLENLDEEYYLSWNYMNKKRKVNYNIFNLLDNALNKASSLNNVKKSLGLSPNEVEDLTEEPFNLWSERWINMEPSLD